MGYKCSSNSNRFANPFKGTAVALKFIQPQWPGISKSPRWAGSDFSVLLFLNDLFVSSDLTAARHFSSSTQNYTTLLLEDEKGILYVGARGAIFSLNASNIADGSHHTVSTTAFHFHACRLSVVTLLSQIWILTQN